MAHEYIVTYEGTIREKYVVVVESEDEARELWSDNEPVSSEIIDGAVERVELAD